MKRRIFSVLFTLVLVLTLGLVTAVPAAAQAATLTVAPITFDTFIPVPEGQATIGWVQVDPSAGNDCVELVNVAGATDWAQVEVAISVALEDISTLSFLEKMSDVKTFGAISIQLYIDYDEDGAFTKTGTADRYLTRDPAEAGGSTTWASVDAMGTGWWLRDGGNTQYTIDPDAAGTSPWIPLADWQEVTKLQEKEVLYVVLGFGGSTHFDALTAYVDDITVNTTVYALEAPDYTSIQDAIDDAETLAGDTIMVAAGMYREDCTVSTDNLTIQGAGADVTTVSTPNPASSPFTIAESNVTIDGFTLTGCTEGSLGAINIVDTGGEISGGMISNNIITGNRAGIRLGNSASGQGIDGLRIVGNAITENTYKAIWFWNAVDYGGQAVSNITISGNEITDNGNTGISTYGPGPNIITLNTISGNDGNGISIKYDDGDLVTINIVEDNTAMGINMHQVTDCVVEENTVSGHLNIGVTTTFWGTVDEVGDSSGIYLHEASVNNTIRYNDLKGNVNGVLIASEGGEQPSANFINFNNISGNTYGVLNALVDPPAPVDTEDNWWGNASGPQPDGAVYTSYGDKVSANVDYQPWLLAEVEEGVPPTTFDKTLALKKDWTLVSTHKVVALDSAWVGTNELSPEITVLAVKYIPGGYESAIPGDLRPVDALYVKTDGGGGVGINYSTGASMASSKDLIEGWNLISSATLLENVYASAILSPLAVVQIGEEMGPGLATFASQGDYNQFSGSLYMGTMSQAAWDALASQTLSPFDGYWAYMNAPKNFGVVLD